MSSDLGAEIHEFNELLPAFIQKSREQLNRAGENRLLDVLHRMEQRLITVNGRLNQMRCGTMNAIQKTVQNNPTGIKMETELARLFGPFGSGDITRTYAAGPAASAPADEDRPLMPELLEPEKVAEPREDGEDDEEEEEDDGEEEEEEEDDDEEEDDAE